MLKRAVAIVLLTALAAPAGAESWKDLLKRSAEDALRKATQPGPAAAPAAAPTPVAAPPSAPPHAAQQPAGTPAPGASAGAPAGPSPAAGVLPVASDAASAPLPTAVRGTPTVAWVTNLGFRDWGAVVLAGGAIVGANSSGKGGLYAVDASTGQLRWKVVTSNKTGEAPVSDGTYVVVPWTTDVQLAAYELASGRLAWSKPYEPVRGAQPVHVDGLVIVQQADGHLSAFDVRTGAERWKLQLQPKASGCSTSRPAVADGVVYVSSGASPPAANPRREYFVHAVEARTGRELWRYTPLSRYPDNYGVCWNEMVAAGGTLVGVADQHVYGVDRATGRELYRHDTRDAGRLADLRGLVAAGGAVYAISAAQFWAIDARSGRTLWTLPGTYRDNFPGTGAADGVVYFQGRVSGVDAAPDGPGVLHAVDTRTRQVLWSFQFPTEEPWSFDVPVVVDGALYVGTYKRMLKLK
jgi:outer membrane protein assembly factor BamB